MGRSAKEEARSCADDMKLSEIFSQLFRWVRGTWLYKVTVFLIVAGLIVGGVGALCLLVFGETQYEIIGTQHVVTHPFGADEDAWHNYIYTMKKTPSWIRRNLFVVDVEEVQYMSTGKGHRWYTYPETERVGYDHQNILDGVRSRYWNRLRALQVVEKAQEAD